MLDLGSQFVMTACQSRPPSLGSKCRSRTVFQTTSNDSTFLAVCSAVRARDLAAALVGSAFLTTAGSGLASWHGKGRMAPEAYREYVEHVGGAGRPPAV